ncbi:hypothetical protein BX616_002056 [Lobosporangium transversale]|uniref:Pentacotripeptide-repeat region of PRORP domain-containing protein n=1 Tax=Lobosporangium transversale TaxID=64571 RepID=A0A1Y2GWG1_9FUNG|nr:hypothetical protein BCR41DRAFT_421049 [Lobosporangium transversale]KAF9902056.1 hypothetical protein BX616_002056 [Lobosporangium transversale]ORZ21033.1 hypothetical protein BCR41DRAFT_421049 [Lobosporangium transversale]|eukprot:XP_021882942.1 hypothetical protein BCR41DRAFT_421049 [Lobosporangium transversale]
MSTLLRSISTYAQRGHYWIRTTTTASTIKRTATTPNTIRVFSATSLASCPIKKKVLDKKITVPRDPYLLSEKIIKFARNGKLDEAITLVLESPKSRQNEVVWNHLIQESSKLGKTNQSWQLLNDMKKRGYKPNDRTFTILLNALAINSFSPNSVSRAQMLYQQMKDSEDTHPNVVHTNALLKVCARKPDYEALQQVYDEMPKVGPNSPDVVTFNIMINSFARMGGDKGFEQAWRIWEDFLDAKTKRPDQVDLDGALIDALLLACREARSSVFMKRGYRIVGSLYDLNLSSGEPTPDAEKLSSPSPSNMTSLDKALYPSKTLGVGPILKMRTIQPRTVELLLSICSKLKDYGKAQRYMDLIRTTYPDFRPDSQLLASLMHFQISNREYEKAIQSWDEIKSLGLSHTPATFKQGLDACLKARNWPKSLEIFSTMKDIIMTNRDTNPTRHRLINPIVQEYDAWTLVSTLKCAIKTKHIPEAIQILQESHWTKVVRNPKYPRANADLAELATKIYNAAVKSARRDSKPTASSDIANQEQNLSHLQGSKDVEKLQRKLKEAKDLHQQLSAILAEYDENKAQREAREREELRDRKVAQRYEKLQVKSNDKDNTSERTETNSWRRISEIHEASYKSEGTSRWDAKGRRSNRDHQPHERFSAFTPSKDFKRDVF